MGAAHPPGFKQHQQQARNDRDYFMHPTREAAISYAKGAGFTVETVNETTAWRPDMPTVEFYLKATPDKKKLTGSGANGFAHYWERSDGR